MMTWVLYDISEDATRNRIASLCRDYGLMRLQKSVFLGETAPAATGQLADRIRITLAGSGEKGNVMILNVCEKCISSIIPIGTDFPPDQLRYPRLIIIG